MENSTVPPGVRAILNEKCADCHSWQTQTPFYGRFAPVSWLLERDIVEGRSHLNFSLWESYSAEQQQTLKAKIVEETKAREMPPPKYRIMHWNARVTDAEVRALTEWARGTAGSDSGATAQPSGEGDPSRGKVVFEKRCTGCHALERDREGPRLQGVFGRSSGSVAGYAYSPALGRAHIVWNNASLERWLADPDAFIPGNNMEFHVPKPQERLDLISFLKQGAGK
jgi:cytochrome c